MELTRMIPAPSEIHATIDLLAIKHPLNRAESLDRKPQLPTYSAYLGAFALASWRLGG
jgi:hypothetical protein